MQKNDDVSLLKEICLDNKDEDGKTVVDYAKDYKSKKVLTWIIKNVNDMNQFAKLFGVSLDYNSNISQFSEVLYYAVWTNTVAGLESLIGKDRMQTFLDRTREQELATGKFPEIFKLLVTDKNIIEDTYQLLFSRWEEQICYDHGTYSKSLWTHGIAELLDSAVKNSNISIFDKYFDMIQTINSEFSIKLNEINKNQSYYQSTFCDRMLLYKAVLCYRYITFKKDTIKVLLDRGNIKLAEKMNSFNMEYKGPFFTEDEINLAKVKSNPKSTDKDIKWASVMRSGYVVIDDLIALGDFDLYQEMLRKESSCMLEELYRLYFSHKYNEMEKIIKKIDQTEELYKGFLQLPHTPDVLRDFLERFIVKKNLDGDLWYVMRRYFFPNKEYLEKLLAPNHNYFIKWSKYPSQISELLNTENGFNDFWNNKYRIRFEQIIDFNDERFFIEACKSDLEHLDWALEKIVSTYPERYLIQKVLLDNGAKLHKTWQEDDDWGYTQDRDIVDEIATNMLKNQIKILLLK